MKKNKLNLKTRFMFASLVFGLSCAGLTLSAEQTAAFASPDIYEFLDIPVRQASIFDLASSRLRSFDFFNEKSPPHLKSIHSGISHSIGSSNDSSSETKSKAD